MARHYSPKDFSRQPLNALVRSAKVKAASRPPDAGEQFASLALDLDGWFDKNLEELPKALRQRVEQEFPSPWDNRTADQRCRIARQLDYQRDPATEQERQYWAEFFEHLHTIQAQKEHWESVATPTAKELDLKESRLQELQQEIDRMESRKRQARGDYFLERRVLDADKGATAATDYVPYPKAMKILREKWQATPEELAAWIFLGPESGGLVAYLNANKLNPPPRFYFAYWVHEDYLAALMACWFWPDDIDEFEPVDRYINGAALIERWGRQPGIRPEAFIRAKIAESRLLDLHPTFGGTRGTFDDEINFPPLSAGLFAMSQIERIETEDALDVAPIPPTSAVRLVQKETREKGGRPKSPLAEAVAMAYHHFLDEGNVAILQPGNIRVFLKSLDALAKDDARLTEFENGNIRAYLAERIKDVKIPRAGECFVMTHDRPEGRKINPGARYSQKDIAKLLTKLRKKYPLPS